jgi:sn-glycerol 3-phosphate transport system substrate-binding protein
MMNLKNNLGKKAAALLLLVMMAFVIVACGSKKEAVTANKPVKIVFWYSVGGKVAEATKVMVEQFNATHQDIQVEAVFQGSYDEAINKLKQSITSKATPSVMQVYDIGTRFMIDSKAVVPAQKWIDQEKFDVSGYEPNIMEYYKVDNQLYSMPFNTSTPILYYNKTMFKEAGLDPENPPKTFEEVAAAAQKLTVKDGSGKITRPGITLAIYGWFFEQFLAEQNAPFANNANGRDSMATAAAFNSTQGEKVLNWWLGMVKEGSAANMGRKTADTQKAFIAGQTAMTIDSTGVLVDILDGVNGKFEVGTGFMPHPADTPKGGVIIGGGSLWMLGGHSEAEEKAAWEFVKFMTAAKQQAYWHIKTGYFPVVKGAYDDPELKKHQEKYPQFKVAIDQLHGTVINRYTQGALLGVFTQARQEIEGAIEQVLNGQATPAAALQKAADSVNGAIERYNQTVK